MTTVAAEIWRRDAGWAIPDDDEVFLARLEADASLLDPEQVRARLEVLDALDVRFGNVEKFRRETGRRIRQQGAAMRSRLEAVHAELCVSIRSAMMRGDPASALLQWIEDSTGDEGNPAPGLGFDFRDELLGDVLQFREPSAANLDRVPERMFYQPTPVRHILRLILASGLRAGDVLVDLGSGLGHVSLLAAMLTGVRSVGVEVEAAYVASARECAERLNLAGVQFIHEDARACDLSSGTVFYLYSPFTGSMLVEVLERLREESTRRPITICTLGPCTRVIAREPWVRAREQPNPGQITVFAS
jgi:hypothetical protein